MEWFDGEMFGVWINKILEFDEIRFKFVYECGQVFVCIYSIDLEVMGLIDDLMFYLMEEFVWIMWDRYFEMDIFQFMIDYVVWWLFDNLLLDNKFCFVYNDFCNGNIMVIFEGIGVVLDWEIVLIGDLVCDIGWICMNLWWFGCWDLEVGGFGKFVDLLVGYEEEFGIKVDLEYVKFWEVFGLFWWVIGCFGMVVRWCEGFDVIVEWFGIVCWFLEC